MRGTLTKENHKFPLRRGPITKRWVRSKQFLVFWTKKENCDVSTGGSPDCDWLVYGSAPCLWLNRPALWLLGWEEHRVRWAWPHMCSSSRQECGRINKRLMTVARSFFFFTFFIKNGRPSGRYNLARQEKNVKIPTWRMDTFVGELVRNIYSGRHSFELWRSDRLLRPFIYKQFNWWSSDDH